MADVKISDLPALAAGADADYIEIVDASDLTDAPTGSNKQWSLSGLSEWVNSQIVPGGRLTLESGEPVPNSDQTAKTNVYYTPYVHDRITLWTGTYWQTIQFSEVTQALGTLTNARPYDVFGYLSAGVLATEVLVWTSDIARATEITLQDGRYSKSGDKTRLYLGTFYTTATTTTEDSEINRYLYNMYNKVPRLNSSAIGTTHTYNSPTYRNWNNGAGTLPTIRFVLGLSHNNLVTTATAFVEAGSAEIVNSQLAPYVDGSTLIGNWRLYESSSGAVGGNWGGTAALTDSLLGKHTVELWQSEANAAVIDWSSGKQEMVLFQ